MFFRAIFLTSILGLTACTRGNTPGETSVDTSVIDTGDTGADTSNDTSKPVDTSNPVDTSPQASTAPQGFAFCAAGGYVESLDYSGVICMGPMDIGVGLSGGNGEPMWQAGPIYILAPE